MIPPFDPATGALPPGIHEATWAEVVERFGFSAQRSALLIGMRNALAALAHAGCRRVYLGGSFISARPDPRDWDGAWEKAGVRSARLDKHIAHGDAYYMKLLYFGEIYEASDIARTGEDFLAFFQHDRAFRPIGLVAVDPATASEGG